MNNATDIGISFKNSVSGEKKLEKYAETLSRINSALAGIDKGKVKEVEQTAKSFKEIEKTNEKVKNVKGGLFDVATITALVHSFKSLTKTFSKMVSQSANYLENMNLLDVAFNNNTKEAKQFVNTLTEMYGLDESWGYKTIGLFKQLSNAMGLADETGTTLAKTLTALSIDLASLYNVNTQSAVEKLTSALAGQTKPVRVFGADITEATLQMTLMENGIDKLVSNLSFAEKRLLIVTSVLNQTKEAQNDWARTIESLANQMRIMDEQISRLTRAIGNVFMPILKTIIPYLNAFLMVITEIISWLAVLVGYNEKEFDFFGGTNDSVEQLTQNLNQAGASANKLKSGLRSFDKLNNITTPSASSSGGGLGVDADILDLFNKTSKDYLKNMMNVEMTATKIRDKIMEWLGFTKLTNEETKDVSFVFDHITSGTVLGALGVGGVIYSGVSTIVKLLMKLTGFKMPTLLAGFGGGTIATVGAIGVAIGLLSYSLYDLYQTNEDFAKSFDEKWQGIKDAIEPIISSVIQLFNTLKSVYDETLKPMVEEIYEIIQTISTTLLEILYPIFTEFILPIIDQLIQIINDIFDIINELWKSYGEPISEAIQKAIKGIGEIFEKLWTQFLQPIIKKVMDIIEDLWNNTLQPMAEKIGGIIGSIIELILALWNNYLQPIVKWLIDVLAPIFEWAFSFIGDIVHTIVKFIGGVINGLLDIFKGIIDFLVGVFTGDFEKAWNGILGILKGVGNVIISIFETVVNFVIDLINGLIKAIYNGVKSLINGVLSTVENVAEFFGFDVDLTISASAPKIPKLTIPRLKTGLDFVPNDYYPAYLDYGERVLTKEENADYNKGIINGKQATNNKPLNATFVINIGSEEIGRVVLNNLQDIAKDNGKPIVIGG
jgi:hypothetical protein